MPYGIEYLDISVPLNAMEAARSNRIRSMLLQRQMEREDREAEQQSGIRAAFQRYGARESPQPSQASPSSPAPAELSEVFGQRDVSWPGTQSSPVPDQTAPEGASEAQRRRELFSSLLTLDPQTAMGVMQAFGQMDDAQFEAAQRRQAVLARAAFRLMEFPEGSPERTQAFQRLAPALMSEGGLTRGQVAEAELSDEFLQDWMYQARDIERLAAEARPQLRNVEGGEVIDENLIGTDRDPVVFRSEYISTPEGLARRPNAGAAPPVLTDEDIRRMEQGGAGSSDSPQTFP